MSLVGTRPPTVDEWDKYELHHRARLATKPGLTGMWQVTLVFHNLIDREEICRKAELPGGFSDAYRPNDSMAWLWRIYGRNTWCSLGCILPIFVLAVFNTNFQYYLWIYWNIY